MMIKKHVRLVIHGNVQGVFFRKYTRQAAIQLGVGGFVMNRPDGTVYVEAAGTPDALQRFIAWCHRGPENSRVDSVKSEPMEEKRFTSFEIKY